MYKKNGRSGLKNRFYKCLMFLKWFLLWLLLLHHEKKVNSINPKTTNFSFEIKPGNKVCFLFRKTSVD